MQLLVLGDLHLGDEGYAAEPHPSWERFDAVVTVGDIAHSRVTITDGKPQQEELVASRKRGSSFGDWTNSKSRPRACRRTTTTDGTRT